MVSPHLPTYTSTSMVFTLTKHYSYIPHIVLLCWVVYWRISTEDSACDDFSHVFSSGVSSPFNIETLILDCAIIIQSISSLHSDWVNYRISVCEQNYYKNKKSSLLIHVIFSNLVMLYTTWFQSFYCYHIFSSHFRPC